MFNFFLVFNFSLIKLILLVICLDIFRLWLMFTIVLLKSTVYYVYKEIYIWMLMHLISFCILNFSNLNIYFDLLSYRLKYEFFHFCLDNYLYFELEMYKSDSDEVLKKISIEIINIKMFLKNLLIYLEENYNLHSLERINYNFLDSDSTTLIEDNNNNKDGYNGNLFMVFEDKKKNLVSRSKYLLENNLQVGKLSVAKKELFTQYKKSFYGNQFNAEDNSKKHLENIVTYRDYSRKVLFKKEFFENVIVENEFSKVKNFSEEEKLLLIERYNKIKSFMDEEIEKNGLDNYQQYSYEEDNYLRNHLKNRYKKQFDNSFELLPMKYKVFTVRYLHENIKLAELSNINKQYYQYTKLLQEEACVNYIKFCFNGIKNDHPCYYKNLDLYNKTILVATHFNSTNFDPKACELIEKNLQPTFLSIDKDGKDTFLLKPVIWGKEAAEIGHLEQDNCFHEHSDSDFSEKVIDYLTKEQPVLAEKMMYGPIYNLIEKKK